MAETVASALQWAQQTLSECDDSVIDSKVLLAHVLERTQTWLYTWPDYTLTAAQWQQFQLLVARRNSGEPVAYLTGVRAFWTLELATSPATLIPRPETELLVESALELMPEGASRVCDLGTGTGAVALAIASERPELAVTGADLQPDAVALARANALRNQVGNARFIESSWFEALSGKFDMIVSNPPYVEADSEYLEKGDVRFEPRSALVAGADGLDDIRIIVAAAPEFLCAGGWVLLEHGFNQADAIQTLLHAAGFKQIHTRKDLAGHARITGGCWQTCE
ncbi:peptide chain release factor N(5)-glutamine methyltransferase [Alteromonas sp. ASW11-19]|uniref:Release factor glutamine methyltransferase n=1 Tax=Alteromonas salexigens TaxID=2982530 RepID=A0ABT2VKM2_9ALTE|nr:peptide chain release factor N(5)-glutamine methyltransferase [Alteromonas salexigens]MCU7553837.1 peptide chain release factor N(5)-glutamine methyltransferase [Alteromonas salexigens]